MPAQTIERPYLMGRSEAETARLIAQADFQAPYTCHLLVDAGIAPGMRVLDVGSGAGDVTLLAARLVGPDGSVVRVDRDPAVLATARARAEAIGHANVRFVQGDIHSLVWDELFDAVIGRLVLMYQPDPVTTLRALIRQLRPGGFFAFQEFNFTAASLMQFPPTPLWRQVWGWMCETIDRVGLDPYSGFHLYEQFQAAGLPAPQMHVSSSAGGGEWGGHAYAAATLRSMLPLTIRFGVATADEGEIDTLADRLRAETIASGGIVKAPEFVGAWSITS